MTPDLTVAYLLAHPEAVSMALPHPRVLPLLALVLLLVVLARRDFPRHRLALAARVGAYTLVVLTLAGLGLSVRLPSQRLSVIAAVDRSESIDAEGRAWEERYLEQVRAALAPGDELGAVVFGRDAAVALPPGEAAEIDLRHTAVAAQATDIGTGLEAAMALFPPDNERRLLLLSDGNETRGHSLAKVARARRAGVTMYAAVPPHAGGADIAVEKLAVAPLVAEGSVFPLRVMLRNHAKERPAVLRLSVDGAPIGAERITVQPGLNAVEIPYRMRGAGSHRLRAEVSVADDRIAANNYREVAMTIGGKPRALLVTTRPRSTLARVLERKDIVVVATTPAAVPSRIEELLGYHCVVFEDVGAAGFSPAALQALERYVQDFGGSLIVAAGEQTYGDPAFRRTAVERLLPVTLEPRRPPRAEREPLALFLLIDRSNSMGYHFRNRLERSETESKLVYARRAALAVVNQLKDSDLVGVIVFDSQPFEVAPLRRVQDNRQQLEQDIPRLQPGGGTDFYEALESAHRQLDEARIATKHIILLTDGDTNRAATDHYALINSLTKSGVSVTTIRIGDDTVNMTLLHDISSQTGGQFYHVENADNLPELLLKDTSQMLAQSPRRDETYAPRLGAASQVLRGVKPSQIPDLHGYAYARPKPGADVLLHVVTRDRKDPILAAWQYGLGRVVAFTASPSDDAESWAGWEGLGKFWSQIVHWAVREQTPWDYALEVRRAEGETTLMLHAFGDLGDGVLTGRLFVDNRPVEVALVPRAPRDFTARLPALPGGQYPLLLTIRAGNGEVSQTTELINVPDRDAEPQEEFEADGPNLALLTALTRGTGGAVDAPVRAVVERRVGSRQVQRSLDELLIPLAMALVLADIGLRRLGRR